MWTTMIPLEEFMGRKGDYVFDCWMENGSLVFGDEGLQLPENWEVIVYVMKGTGV